MIFLKFTKEEILEYDGEEVEIDKDGNIFEYKCLELPLVWTLV